MGIFLVLTKKSFAISFKSLCCIMLHGANYFFIALFLFLALRYADSGLVTTIFYTNPIFVLLLSVLFFHEKLEVYKLVLILITSFGVGLLSGFFSEGLVISFSGLVLSLLAGIGYAVYIILLIKLPAHDVSREVFSFYLFLFGALTALLYMLLFGKFIFAATMPEWINILGSALVTGVISNMLLISALPKIGAVPTVIIGVLEPLTAVFIGILHFGENMTFEKALGIIIVVCAIILLTVIPNLQKNSI
jgi:drug/metabolite transporter (DMT)-like permease